MKIVLSDDHLGKAELLEIFESLNPTEREELYSNLNVTEDNFRIMYLEEYEKPLMNITYYSLSQHLLWYVPPILVIIGTIGNLLSFLVLVREPMRRVSAYNYLSVLSITDTLVLYFGLFRLWIGEITGNDFRDYSSWSCKMMVMLNYTASDYSVWLLIAVTVERYIATVHVLRASTMCTLSRARKVIVIILLVLIAINLHFLWTADTQLQNKDDVAPTCGVTPGYSKLIFIIWPWIDAIIYSFLPFIIILTLNGLIIHRVTVAKRGRRGLSEARINTSEGLISRPCRPAHHEGSARITFMLLIISFTFLLTTLPVNITMIVHALMERTNYVEASKHVLAKTVTLLLMYTNHSINFFLYLLTGQKFRQQLTMLICSCLPKNMRWGQSMYTQVDKSGHNGITSRKHCAEMTVMTDDRLSNGSS